MGIVGEGSWRNVPALMSYGNSCPADKTILHDGSGPIRSLFNTTEMKRALTAMIKIPATRGH